MSFLKKYKKRIVLLLSAFVILSAAFVFDGTRQSVSNENDDCNSAPVPQAAESVSKPAEETDFSVPEHDDGAETANILTESDTIRKELSDVKSSEINTENTDSEKTADLPDNNQVTEPENANGAISETDVGTVISCATSESDAAELMCTVSISCSSVLDNMDMLDQDKADFIPKDGIILKETRVKLENGDSVFDVLARVTRDNSIHMEFTDTPVYKTKYVEGIANIYELDCGSLSGWQYSVNGVFPNVGCSAYYPQNGDVIEWQYTCDLGRDIGNAFTAEGGNG